MQTRDFDDESIDLRGYLTILRRRKWTIALVTLLLLGLVLGMSYLQTPLYSAEARVLIAPVAGAVDPNVQAQVPLAPETESQVASSEPVAEIVRDELNLQTPAFELLENLEVTGIIEAQVLQVRYTAEDPELARDLANAFAEGYITFRREQVLEAVVAAQEAAQQQVDEASQELTEISSRLEAAERVDDDTLATTLESQRNTLVARLGVLQQRMDDLDPTSSLQFSGAQLIQGAQVPVAPSSPDYLRNGAIGVFLGLGFGVGLAFLRERLDDRFRDRSDIESAIQAPVLATVPQFGSKRNRDADLVTVLEPNNVASETYRTLRTNLQFITAQRSLKSIIVTSASAGEGKTITSANLGVALAQAGRKVILVSADLRRPTLEGYFGIDGKQDGLSSWLADPQSQPWGRVKDPGIRNLRVLPCGPVPSQPAELLSTPQLSALIETLEDHADFVIFDTPPILAVADAAILAPRVGGVVLVIDAAATHRSAAEAARQHLDRAGGSVLGIVSNSYDPSGAGNYYYANYDYSSSESLGSGNGESSGRQSLRRRMFRSKT